MSLALFFDPLATGFFLCVMPNFPKIYACWSSFGIDFRGEVERTSQNHSSLQIVESDNSIFNWCHHAQFVMSWVGINAVCQQIVFFGIQISGPFGFLKRDFELVDLSRLMHRFVHKIAKLSLLGFKIRAKQKQTLLREPRHDKCGCNSPYSAPMNLQPAGTGQAKAR